MLCQIISTKWWLLAIMTLFMISLASAVIKWLCVVCVSHMRSEPTRLAAQIPWRHDHINSRWPERTGKIPPNDLSAPAINPTCKKKSHVSCVVLQLFKVVISAPAHNTDMSRVLLQILLHVVSAPAHKKPISRNLLQRNSRIKRTLQQTMSCLERFAHARL